jgi:cytochrome c oxidase cbb3-type subunit 3
MMATEHEQDRLLDHNYDGIQEYDNPMPRWWVWIFWATIAFSVAYAADPTGRIKGPGRVKEYEQQMADAARRWPAPVAALDVEGLVAIARDPRAVAAGKAVFDANCAACHRADGGGLIGPNLTDEYWLHGGSLTEIQHTITEGVLEKGMPTWAKVLKPEQIGAVTVYVASLHDTHPKDPKPPQGVKIDR